MEKEIKNLYENILKKLDELITSKNKYDILKIKKRCEGVYNDIIKYSQNGMVKKQQIDCFNWFHIYIKILENENGAYLSNVKKCDKNKKEIDKNSKGYIIAQNKKRIYKIIPKSIDYINKTTDYDFDPHYCIFDVIETFENDANKSEQFPYKKNTTELCMIFMDTPCDSVLDFAKEKNIKIININDLPLHSLKKYTCINIDINVMIALCSDIIFMDPCCEFIDILIEKKTFIGFDTKKTTQLTSENYLDYILKEYNKIINEIKKYDKAIICLSAYNDTKRILDINGTETEKKRLNEIINMLNIEIIDNTKLKCSLIDENISNGKKIYNQIENEVIKTGYIYDAVTFTSNHRHIEHLESKNILIDYILSPSLNLIKQINKKIS